MSYSYLDCLALYGVGGAHPGGLHLTKHILSREKLDNTKSVLDAGCGTGQTSAFIAEHYQATVTALDYNKIMLDKAKQRFSSLQLPIDVLHGSVEDLPFEDGLFDVVLSESVTSFTDINLTIPELKRVILPNGVLLAIEMVLESPIKEEEKEPIIDFYGVHQLLTESEWHQAFQKAGFKQISIENMSQRINNNELHNAPDFIPSDNIDKNLIKVLEKHGHLTEVYKNILGVRLFRCTV